MKFAGLVTAASVALGASAAGAVSITNGDFESGPTVGGQGYTTVFAGQTSITGWTVGGDSVDYVGGYWAPESGSYSIDVAGNADGSLSQTIATTAGQSYKVTFWLAGNPAGVPVTKTLDVSTGGAPTAYTFDTYGHSVTSMGWTQETYNFTATSGSTVLTFASNGAGSPYGPALDNVSISAVPEAATWALMIGGIGLVGYGLRRRASKSALA